MGFFMFYCIENHMNNDYFLFQASIAIAVVEVGRIYVGVTVTFIKTVKDHVDFATLVRDCGGVLSRHKESRILSCQYSG